MTLSFPPFPSQHDDPVSLSGVTPLSLPSAQPSTLWIPLHEQQAIWADFGTDALSAAECAATGTAFLALSWEQRAMRSHLRAWQEQQRGRVRGLARCLAQCVHALDEASTAWSRVLVWLERAGNDGLQDAQTCEQVRVLSTHAVQQHHRLTQLARLVQHELLHGTPSVPMSAVPFRHTPQEDRS